MIPYRNCWAHPLTIKIRNLPAYVDFDVLLARKGSRGIDGILVDSFDSRKGGRQTITFEIPCKLWDRPELTLRLESDEGYYAYINFTNEDTP